MGGHSCVLSPEARLTQERWFPRAFGPRALVRAGAERCRRNEAGVRPLGVHSLCKRRAAPPAVTAKGGRWVLELLTAADSAWRPSLFRSHGLIHPFSVSLNRKGPWQGPWPLPSSYTGATGAQRDEGTRQALDELGPVVAEGVTLGPRRFTSYVTRVTLRALQVSCRLPRYDDTPTLRRALRLRDPVCPVHVSHSVAAACLPSPPLHLVPHMRTAWGLGLSCSSSGGGGCLMLIPT